jgi:hypothetical protein
MNNLPAPKIFPFPPRHQVGKSWNEIAGVFEARGERERLAGWARLGDGNIAQFERHLTKAETLFEAAAWCRGQEREGA